MSYEVPQMGFQVPRWEERTPYGPRMTDPYARLLEDRIVFLGTRLDDEVANGVMAQLLCLQADSPNREISLYINSPGGAFSALTAIYDTMAHLKPDIRTFCLGQAGTEAAILLAAGARGKRTALRHSRVTLGQPRLDLGEGPAADLTIRAAEIARTREVTEELLAACTGRPAGEIRHDLERDRILTADEALAYGLIDQVLAD